MGLKKFTDGWAPPPAVYILKYKSYHLAAQEEVAFMLENMDSWRRGPAVRNFLQPHLELLATPRP